jgi:membrane-anchored mycosin MYCP
MTSAIAAARLCAAAFLATVPLCTAPEALGVTPPPVDDAALPKSAPPAPPQPTEQHEHCVVSQATTAAIDPGQMKGLDLPSLWRLSRGAGQTVAVIDTGVSRHRLLPHLVPGGDYVHAGDGTDDCDGHGTIVAGIIGAAPDERSPGFSGIAPDATIIGIRQSSNKFRATQDPSSAGFGDVDTLAMAVRTAADMGATVINVSTVACLPADSSLDDRALGAALAYAVDVKNVVVVAAAGNVGGPGQCSGQNPALDPARPGQPDWADVKVVVTPAWYDDYVLTVGSVAPDGTPSRFSLAGPWVDVAAPGEGIVSLDPDGEGLIDKLTAIGDPRPISGTSYAAPVVSAVAALIRARSPELTARQVMERIEQTAHRPPAGWDPVVGHGVIDALAPVSGATAISPRTDASTTKPVATPFVTPPDGHARQIALRGAAIGVAMTVAIVAMTASTARLRRSRDGVSRD